MSPPRGRCGGCGRSYTLTLAGLVRGHHPVMYGPPCPGSGMPPIAADEPLVATTLADLRHENATLRQDLVIARARLAAAEAHARASDKWRELARLAMESMFTEHDAMFARWKADDASLDAQRETVMARLRQTLADR